MSEWHGSSGHDRLPQSMYSRAPNGTADEARMQAVRSGLVGATADRSTLLHARLARCMSFFLQLSV